MLFTLINNNNNYINKTFCNKFVQNIKIITIFVNIETKLFDICTNQIKKERDVGIR